MKIYCITSPNTELVYVGKTIQTLAKRISEHRSYHKRYVSGKTTKYCTSYKVMEFGDAVIELIEETDDSRREAHWIRELGACNQMKMELDWSDHASACEYKRKHRMENIDAFRKRDRKYRVDHRVELNKRANEKIPCDHCGKSITRTNMATHKRTKRCLEFIQEPVLGDSPDLTLIEQPTV